MELAAPSSSASFLAAVVAGAALFLVTVLRLRPCSKRKYRLPPGPRQWPVIGYLNLIGPLPHHSIHELSKRYGPLMSLRFGSFPVVVGSSVDTARLLLKTHDLALIDRPQTAAGKYTTYNCGGLFYQPYGAYWRQGRRLCQAELFNARRLASLEYVCSEEVRAMLSDLSAAVASPLSSAAAGGSSGGHVVALKEHLYMVNLNVISRMLLGKKYIVDGSGSPVTPEEFRWLIDEHFFLNGVLNIADMIPWLSWLDPQGYVKRMKRSAKMLDRFLEHVLDEHNERRRREGKDFVAMDMMDVLLELADDPNLEVQINRDNVKGFILDLMGGGTDTSAVTVEWAMSEILRNPEVLAKATDELDRVIGRGRLVAEEDIPNLPHMEAIVKETMRLHPVAPHLTPRLCREDVSVGSYDIPAGTRVFINAWAVGRDPAVWEAPMESGAGPAQNLSGACRRLRPTPARRCRRENEWGPVPPLGPTWIRPCMEFRPEQFVGSSVDVKGQHFELLPFGSGRRMCPGIGLALRMVPMILANLLHAFAWREARPWGVASSASAQGP